jgi:hypothetical protein
MSTVAQPLADQSVADQPIADRFMAAPSRRKEFDHLKRYLLPDPVTGGKDVPWTRVSTYAKSISDMYGLTQWEKRMVAKGIGLRSDLYALACATPIEDRKQLDDLASQAKAAAEASRGANLGTALHSFTESLDRGLEPVVPAEWRADVDAYRAQMSRHNLQAVPEYIERVVVIPELNLAGKYDRLLRSAIGNYDLGLFVGDVKTTQRIEFSWMEIAVQLACYAHANHIWDPVTESYTPMPAVDLKRAVVMHVPAGGGVCDLYDIDIAKGWEVAQLCAQVRAARSFKSYAQPLAEQRSPEPVNGYADRLRTAASVGELSAIWKEANAAGKWTHDLEVTGMARKSELESGA